MKGTKLKFQNSSYRRGFTLLEMIVVIGIIALILGAAAAVIGRGGAGAKIQLCGTIVDGVGTKLEEYRLLGETYPSQAQGLEALVSKPSIAPVPRRYTQLYDEIPKDPWTNELRYKFPGSKNSSKPEVISAGPDGQFDTEDDISNQD